MCDGYAASYYFLFLAFKVQTTPQVCHINIVVSAFPLRIHRKTDEFCQEDFCLDKSLSTDHAEQVLSNSGE